MPEPIILSSPVTHSDWCWHHRDRIGTGKDSVQYILDRCKQVGLRKIYWRCFDGGKANYASKLADRPGADFDMDNYHAYAAPEEKLDWSWLETYKSLDTLKEAVSYGHEIGLEIHAWVTINEDDHPWALTSRFSRQHPHYRWVKRSGMPYNSQLSFAFEEVRQYKLGLLKEILEYDIDGVFFDWVRTGDIRNAPQATPDGTADFGYEKPLVEAFQKQHSRNPCEIPNNDESWVRFRAQPQTVFMRDAHKLIKAKNNNLPIAVMGYAAWAWRGYTPHINGNLYGLLIDVETWAKEGLIDEAVAWNLVFTPGGSPEKVYRYTHAEVGEHCNVWLYWELPPNAEDFTKSIELAQKVGAKQMLYWESDYMDLPERAADAEELTKAMAAHTTKVTK